MTDTTDVPGDEVPEYDENDPEGDRRPYLDSSEHSNIEDIVLEE